MASLTKREISSIALAIEFLVAKKFKGSTILDYSIKAGKDWYIHFVILDKFGKYRGQDYTFFGGSISTHEDVTVQELIKRASKALTPLCTKTIELATCENPDYENLQGKSNIVNSLVKFLF